MRGRVWEILGDQFRKKTENSISILSYLQKEKGYRDHLASIFNAWCPLNIKIIHTTAGKKTHQPKLKGLIQNTSHRFLEEFIKT